MYELAEEVRNDWKAVAGHMGLTFQQTEIIKIEAHIPREQAWKMLSLLHSKMGSDFKVDELHGHLQQLRKDRHTEELKSKV